MKAEIGRASNEYAQLIIFVCDLCVIVCTLKTIWLIELIIAVWTGNSERHFLNIGHSEACLMLVYTE